ncbi:VOC family protein [Paenibacillus albus]|uniref:Glyoxalase/fosfomycin resistance/dioxygenase domain-containing protein n=1 Tax=Paenibacillus albus TaxID=2495582 RepID=A0A3Q8X6G3_9BACL|nr:VOC family protein [Paenibacillus albus]AZN41152.1 hypothetical protein EJC50_16865 [Paenibacillus albus]
MSEQIIEKTKPFIMDLMTLYLPAKDPYLTAKWYVDIFGFDPNVSDHSPLKPDADLVVLETASGLSLFFIKSNDSLPLHFNNSEGYNHAVLLFRVNNSEIEEVYTRMKEHDVEMATDGIKDRGG